MEAFGSSGFILSASGFVTGFTHLLLIFRVITLLSALVIVVLRCVSDLILKPP